MLFLAISTFSEFLCVLLYSFVFAKLPIVKHFRMKAASEGSKTVSADLAAAGIKTTDGGETVRKFESRKLYLVLKFLFQFLNWIDLAFVAGN